MISVVFTLRAERDIRHIWLSIAKDNPLAADNMLRKFQLRSDELALFPQSGSPRPDLGAGFRIITIYPYLMLYRFYRDKVTIVRVLHGAQHLPNALN